MTRRTRNSLIGGVLSAGLVIGLFLVVTGGSADSPDATAPTEPGGTATTEPTTERAEPLALPAELTQEAVATLSGLAIPATASEFLTARLDSDRQLDVTFVIPADSVDAFLADSGLETPEDDRRVVLHSSPLWKLNPDPGTTLAGTSDTVDDINRAVELLTAADGSVRVRAVLTSAA